MAGRKRKSGKREKSGKLRRDSRMNTGEKPNAMAARETVALQRCRALGWGYEVTQGHRTRAIEDGVRLSDLPVVGSWRANQAQQLEAIQPVYGTVEGRLFKAGKLNADQYAAATAYARMDDRLRKVLGLPRSTVKAADMSSSGGDGASDPFDVDESSIMAMRSRQADFTRCLRDASAIAATMCVVLHHQEPTPAMLEALRRGLDAVYRDMIAGRRAA